MNDDDDGDSEIVEHIAHWMPLPKPTTDIL